MVILRLNLKIIKQQKIMANKNEKATFDAAGKSEAFFTKYRNVILGAVAAIILVVAAVVCYNTFIGVLARTRPAQHWLVARSISTPSSLTRPLTETALVMQAS